MLIIPIYDSIVLPHSTMYIPKENIVDLGGRQVEVNDKIIFLVCKERLNYSKISKSAFQKIGVSGVIADIDKNGLVTIDTKEYKCRCASYSLKSMSGHADFSSLLNYYSNINCNKIVLHHGSSAAKENLANELKKEYEKKCKTTRVVIANSSLKFML